MVHVASMTKNSNKFNGRDPESFYDWKLDTLAVVELQKSNIVHLLNGDPRPLPTFAQIHNAAASQEDQAQQRRHHRRNSLHGIVRAKRHVMNR